MGKLKKEKQLRSVILETARSINEKIRQYDDEVNNYLQFIILGLKQSENQVSQITPLTISKNKSIIQNKSLVVLLFVFLFYIGINLFTPEWLPQKLRLINSKKELEGLLAPTNISPPVITPTPKPTSIPSPTPSLSLPKKIIYITTAPQDEEINSTEPTEQNNTNQNININIDQSTQSQSQSINTEGTSQSISTSCNQGKCTKVTCKNGSCTTEVYNK